MIKSGATSFKTRIFEVDVLRGCAIVLMVIFHFGYDLAAFGWTDYDTGVDMEWRIFRAIIVSGFLLAVGMSSYLAYSQSVNFKKLFRSVCKLFTVSLFLSISSYFMYPNAWVYFGIIHFITLSLLLSVVFTRVPTLSLLLACLIFIAYYYQWLTLHPVWLWSVENIGIPERTVDLVVFFPWFAVVLLGIFLMHKKLFGLCLPQNNISTKLASMGKHSLLIYLLHQPILYGLLYCVKLVIG